VNISGASTAHCSCSFNHIPHFAAVGAGNLVPQGVYRQVHPLKGQGHRAGIRHGVGREPPDFGLRDESLFRFNRVPDIYQGNFRSYFAYVVLLTLSIR
jgi:hypothetical protein